MAHRYRTFNEPANIGEEEQMGRRGSFEQYEKEREKVRSPKKSQKYLQELYHMSPEEFSEWEKRHIGQHESTVRRQKMEEKYAEDVTPSGYRAYQQQQYEPEQMDIWRQMKEDIGPDSYYGRLARGDESAFDELEAPAFNTYNALQGNLANQYASQGGIKSTGFANRSTDMASQFAQELRANRMNIQNNAIKMLHEMRHSFLQERPFQRGLAAKEQRGQSNDWISGGTNLVTSGISAYANSQAPGSGAPIKAGLDYGAEKGGLTSQGNAPRIYY